LRPRILVDTNIWRYLIDLNGLETVYRAAKGADGLILACPAVLYEMLRLQDAPLRHRLIKAICRSRWFKMMPEVFEESAEFRSEIARLRPSWLLSKPDLLAFNRLYNDWNGPRGVWWRARHDPSRAAAVLQAVEGDHVPVAYTEAIERRSEMGKITTFDTVTLDKWTTTFPLKPGGWDGDPVETWRAETAGYYIGALLEKDTSQSSAAREWLEPWIDLTAIQKDLPSFARLFWYETAASYLPRNWLRWALRALQATRTTTPGTPVDNQIGSYLVDADFLVTADRAFASIVQRIANEEIIRVATPVLTSAESCITLLTGLLQQKSSATE
jgi:hypothetical protein